MTQLRYKGSSTRYVLENADLKRHGVDGFTKTIFDKSNNFTADVSNDAAEKMVELMPKDFEIADNTTATPKLDLSGDDASSGDQEDGEGSSKKRKS